MRTFIGAATLVLLGVSPWILPSLAVAAAKMTRDEARGTCAGEVAQRRANEREDGRGERRAHHCQAMQDRTGARLTDRRWPWP